MLEVRKLLRAELPGTSERLSKLMLELFSGYEAWSAFRVKGIPAVAVIAAMA